MKHVILILFIMVQLGCATQNSSKIEDAGLKGSIKKELPVHIENQTIDEEIDLTSLLEPQLISEGVYQVTVKSHLTFKKCVFTKPVRGFRKMENGHIVVTAFQGNLTFIDCIFKDQVSFRGSSIFGRTDFTGSTFNQAANFEEINCHDNAFFNQCKFEGDLRFQNSFFNRKANYMGIECYATASFQNSVFNSELQISAGKFYGYVDFALIDCRGKALFNYAEFKKTAEFGYAIFFQDLDFVNSRHTTTNFTNGRFLGKLRFDKSEVVASLSFQDSNFLLGMPKMEIATEKLMISN